MVLQSHSLQITEITMKTNVFVIKFITHNRNNNNDAIVFEAQLF